LVETSHQSQIHKKLLPPFVIHARYFPLALGGPSVQGEQQDRLRTLAAQVAAESDAKKFHALLIELNRLLSQKDRSVRGNGKTSPEPPTH
jgi:hypothetical protein